MFRQIQKFIFKLSKFLFYIYFFVALCLFPFLMYTVFPLGVLYQEHSQKAFDCVVIACSLESIWPEGESFKTKR